MTIPWLFHRKTKPTNSSNLDKINKRCNFNFLKKDRFPVCQHGGPEPISQPFGKTPPMPEERITHLLFEHPEF
jgi:hypothetical protein